MNLNNNEQEIPEVQLEEYALKLDAKDFACRSKAKAKPQKRDSASSPTKTFNIGKRTWTDIEPQDYSPSDYSVSKKLINLLRHGSLHRENYGAIEFWRVKDYLQNHFMYCHHWSDEKEKNSMAGGGGNKKRYQHYTDSSVKVLQDAILLILLYRTMSLFRTVSSSALIMSDVQSIYIPSLIQD